MKFYIKILLLIIPCLGFTQTTFSGTILNTKNEPIPDAIIAWKGSEISVNSDIEGAFTIERISKKDTLIIIASGYATVKRFINPKEKTLYFEMATSVILNEVEINGKRTNINLDALELRNVEYVSSSDLKKAPCCNLSESFENSGVVDVSFSDAITGAKEIQMLGLRGIYSQLLLENRPTLYGVNSAYALEYVPGTWLSSIQISKGSGSVTNGYQSITGQINCELKKPNEKESFFLNLFAETSGRTEMNLHLRPNTKGKFKHILLLHADNMSTEQDRDKNGFLDAQLKKQYNGMYRMFYNGDKWKGQFNIQYVDENRNGGQLKSIPNPYKINIVSNRVESWAKLAYTGFIEPYRQLGSQYGFTKQNMTSVIGNRLYKGNQTTAYINILYATIFNTTDHKITYGINGQYDKYIESLDSVNLDQNNQTLGLYSEYTFANPNWGADYNDWNIILGMRYDYHNRFNHLFTPKLNIKYNFSPNTSLKLSSGIGYRTSNVIAENIGLLATGRAININKNLNIEKAVNSGVSFTTKASVFNKMNTLNIDCYYTSFNNQIIADQDADSKFITFKNLNGKSSALTTILFWNVELNDAINIKAAYKYNLVKSTLGGIYQDVPMVPKQRGLLNIGFESPNNHWLFNSTTQWIGSSRMIIRHDLPTELHIHQTAKSPSYFLQSVQLTYKLKGFDIYGGAENLFGYTQQHLPILDYENPFSKNFEATQVYAPIFGARVYMGLRYSIE
jgi:outer membrane receptor for ferrienterochelin and colicins